MPPRLIHLVRHGQGHHQLEPTISNSNIPDATLTGLGVYRCRDFATKYPRKPQVDLLVSSPLRRAIQTAHLCFQTGSSPRTDLSIVLHPDAQEDSALPSDTPSSVEVLREEWGNAIDTSLLTGDYTSKWRRYSPEPEALHARARALRAWLRGREEEEIVVAGHGRIFAYVVGEMDEQGVQTGPYWMNRCWRSFTFAHDNDTDPTLKETEESVERREEGNADLSH